MNTLFSDYIKRHPPPSSSVMIVTLHRKQRVSAGSRICFQHCADSGRKHEIELNKRQFKNLNDFIDNLRNYHSLHYFPLGGGLWLFQKGDTTKIIDNQNDTFFWFYEKAWHFYITHVHKSLYASVCHGKSYHHQPHAQYESRSSHSSRKSLSRLSRRHQTLSRSPGNDRDENDKRSQHANVSRRKGANSRMRVRHGSGRHASRVYREIETDQHDAAFSSDENDSIEPSDQCSVEEGSVSPQDRLD